MTEGLTGVEYVGVYIHKPEENEGLKARIFGNGVQYDCSMEDYVKKGYLPEWDKLPSRLVHDKAAKLLGVDLEAILELGVISGKDMYAELIRSGSFLDSIGYPWRAPAKKWLGVGPGQASSINAFYEDTVSIATLAKDEAENPTKEKIMISVNGFSFDHELVKGSFRPNGVGGFWGDGVITKKGSADSYDVNMIRQKAAGKMACAVAKREKV